MLRHFALALVAVIAPSWSLAAAPAAVDPKAIDELIQQLGSDEFRTRESATAALERIGVPTLSALRKAAAAHPELEGRRRAASLVTLIENSLDQLLIDYRALGLPLLDDVPLVRFHLRPGRVGWHRVGDGDEVEYRDPPTYAYGFLLKPAKDKSEATILHGLETVHRPKDEIEAEVSPRQKDAGFTDDGSPRPATALVLAVQLHARGWPAARLVLERGFKKNTDTLAGHALRMEAWEYWHDQLFSGNHNDWTKVLPQLKALVAREPELDSADHRAVLKSLELALVPSKARPRTMEAFIDDFMRVKSVSESLDPGEPLGRVFDFGFEAVPVLLDHLKDDRLTCSGWRSEWGSSFKNPPLRYRVGDLAGELLRCFAGPDASKGWPPAGKNRAEFQRHAMAWWEKAEKEGEKAYLVAHVLPTAPYCRSPIPVHIRLLKNKYPESLPSLYRQLLEKRTELHSELLAETIETIALPKDEKVALLALGLEHKDPKHFSAALYSLMKVDRERAAARVIAVLGEIPETPSRPYAECKESANTRLVCAINHERVWHAFERAVRKADPGLRLELLKHMNDGYPTLQERRRRLAFLACFLDDQSVRDVTSRPDMYDGIYTAFRYPRLEVRNFAAMKMAELLHVPANLHSKSDNAEWEKLRERMRKAASQSK